MAVLDLDHWVLKFVSYFVFRDSNFISMDDSYEPWFPSVSSKKMWDTLSFQLGNPYHFRPVKSI